MNQDNYLKMDIKSDKWVLDNESTLGDTVTFNFGFLPNRWFNKTVKELTIDAISAGKPTLATLVRYNGNLHYFFDFLKEYSIELNTLKDLTNQHTQMFIFYLQNLGKSNSTNNISMSALKWMVEFGWFLEYEGFPEHQIFDGEEYSALKVADEFKTQVIPDDVMRQIEMGLKSDMSFTNLKFFKYLMQIGIDTGLRLSEVLELEEGCISEDLTGKPILYVYSDKSESERYIPVSNRVAKAIRKLEEHSFEARKITGSKNLTCYKRIASARKPYGPVTQSIFRKALERFVKQKNIRDSQGHLYPLTFHAFRHTLGTVMLNRGMSIFEVQDYLGHLSLHSTALYAKINETTTSNEYKKLGFIGKIVEEVSKKEIPEGQNFENEALLAAALPDGSCSKPINNEGKICAKFNQCVLCPKFITTPDHIDIHKSHLERLRADRIAYMESEYIGTTHHLDIIEDTLKAIIERLEGMKNGTESKTPAV